MVADFPTDPELEAAVDAIFNSHETLTLGNWDREVREATRGPYAPGSLDGLLASGPKLPPDEDDDLPIPGSES